MSGKNNTLKILSILAIILALGAWLFAGKDENVVSDKNDFILGQVDALTGKEMLTVIGYDSLDQLDSLASNFQNGEKFVNDMKKVLNGLDDGMFIGEADVYDAYLTLAVSLNILKETERSIKVYEELLKLNPNHPVVHNNLAHLYQENKDFEKAEEHYLALIKANPTWTQGFSDLADMYRAFLPEKKPEIITIFGEALTENPTRIPLLIYLADFYESEKNFPKSREYYNKVLEINPENADALSGLQRIGS